MTRVACIGGFLGAGKTTAIIQAAKTLISRGIKVGIITNDQGQHLVDTELVRRLGIPAEEVGGGCFCCRFSEFARNAERLVEQSHAEVILAEAVGSCTDLSATVCRRLQRAYSGRFVVAPLTVMVDPGRIREMLRPRSLFDDDVRYLFGKQLAEADHILVTKADLLHETEITILRNEIQQLVGDIPVSNISAKTGLGVSEWVDLLLHEESGAPQIEVDYRRYGAAEAALGWLNASVDLTSQAEFRSTDLGEALVAGFQRACRDAAYSVAHLKIMFITTDGSDWIALTDTQGSAAWGLARELPASREASMIINARVCAEPEQLRNLIESGLEQVAAERNILASIRHIESFAPQPPVPPVMVGAE